MVDLSGIEPESNSYKLRALPLSYKSILVDPVGLEPTCLPFRRRALLQLSYGSLDTLHRIE